MSVHSSHHSSHHSLDIDAPSPNHHEIEQNQTNNVPEEDGHTAGQGNLLPNADQNDQPNEGGRQPGRNHQPFSEEGYLAWAAEYNRRHQQPQLQNVLPIRTPNSLFRGRKPNEYNYGDDIHDYLKSFDIYKMVTGLQSEQAFQVFCTFLDNRSLNRVLSLKLTGKQLADWESVKEDVIQKLDPTYDTESSIDELFAVKQTGSETTQDFADRLEKTAQMISAFKFMAVEATDKLMKDAFINGLKSQQMMFCLLQKSKLTYDTALLESSKLEKILGKIKAKVTILDSLNDAAGLLTIEEKETPTIQPFQTTCWTCQRVGHVKKDCPEEDQRKCYNCGASGHLTRDCRSLTQRRGCNYCQGTNHIERNCFKKERDDKEQDRYYNQPRSNEFDEGSVMCNRSPSEDTAHTSCAA